MRSSVLDPMRLMGLFNGRRLWGQVIDRSRAQKKKDEC